MRVLRIAVVLGTSVAIVVWLVLPALVALSGRSSQPSEPSLIGFAGNDSELGLSVDVYTTEASPSEEQGSFVFFRIEFAMTESASPIPGREYYITADPTARPLRYTADSTETEAYGVSVVLMGDFARALSVCEDKDIRINRDLDFATLTDSEQNAVRAFLEGAGAAELRDETEAEDGKGVATVGDLAESFRYVTMQPTQFYPVEDRLMTIQLDGQEARTYPSYFNYFRCSFERFGTWSHVDSGLQFRHPSIVASSSSDSDRATVELGRYLSLTGDSNSEILSVSSDDAALRASVATVESQEASGDAPKPIVSLDAVEIQLTDAEGSYRREWSIFVGGIGIAAVIAIWVEIWRSAMSATRRPRAAR